MSRIKRILKSNLKRNIGVASMTLLAAAYTIPRVGSNTQSIQAMLLPAVVSGDNSSGWDLSNIALRERLVDQIFSAILCETALRLWLVEAQLRAMISASSKTRIRRI